MALVEIILIAIGLSMDAFAVSITLGLSVKKLKMKHIFVPSLYFGFFQALMPLTGFFAGFYFANKIHFLDHWIAFVLLLIIGGKMIKDSFEKNEDEVKGNPFKSVTLLLLAIATSIDALAVGVAFAFLKVNIWSTVLIIGFTTFCIALIGVKIGNMCGAKYKSKAEFLGGAVLVLLGFKILIEHLFF